MKNVANSGDFGRHLAAMYSGMFAGLMFLTAIACTTGIATTVAESGNLILLSLTSAFIFLNAHSLLK